MKIKNLLKICGCFLLAATCLSSCGSTIPELIIYEYVNAATKDKIKSYGMKFKTTIKEKYGEDINISFLDFASAEEMDTRMQMNALNNFFPTIVISETDNIGAYVKKYGAFVQDLEEISSGKIDDFVGEYLREGQSYSTKGTYSLPLYKTNDVLYYSYDDIIGKTINNVTLSEDYMNNLNWEKFLDVASLIKSNKEMFPNVKTPILYQSELNLLLCLANDKKVPLYDLENGTLNLTFSNDKTRSLISEIAELYQKGILTSKTLIKQGSSDDESTYFSAGNAVMYVGSALDAGNVSAKFGAKKVGFTSLPTSSTLFSGPSISAFKDGSGKSKNEKEVKYGKEFISYLLETSSLSNLSIASNGYIPSRISSTNDTIYESYLKSNTLQAKINKFIINSEDVKDSYIYYPSTFGSKFIKNSLSGALIQVALGKKDINRALDDAMSSCLPYI
ncbi:MAG: hypothetical protein RR578_02625 [Bacilli bacterium]